MATEAALRAQKKYDQANKDKYKNVFIKVNRETESDIVEKLESVENVQGYIKGLIRKESSVNWILFSEKMPEDGTWNLFTDGKKVSIERYKADALDHFYPEGRFFSLDDAIAWIPLPEQLWTEAHELGIKS